MVNGCDLILATLNFATSYISLAPNIHSTLYFLPDASTITALYAPLHGVNELMASPLFPTKNPLAEDKILPSSLNVVSVKTDFTAFDAHPGV